MDRAFDFIADTADAVFVVDRRQRIVLWNESARELLGFAAREVIGRTCYEVLGGTDASGCPVCGPNCAMQRSAARGEPVAATRDVEVNTAAGGRMWVGVSTVVFPSSWHELSVLAHLMRDVTARKGLEASYEQLLRCIVLDRAAVGRAVPRQTLAVTASLTEREQQVLALLACGTSTDGIATRLSIGKTTVRTHIQRILSKLGVHSRLEAVALSPGSGLHFIH